MPTIIAALCPKCNQEREIKERWFGGHTLVLGQCGHVVKRENVGYVKVVSR